MNIVSLSGGYDSTLLLYKLVKEGLDVTGVYCDVPLVDSNKKRIELESIEQLKSSGLISFDFYKLILKCDQPQFGVISWEGGIPQQALWATALILFAPHNSTIYFGYHHGDDFFHFHGYIENIRQAICPLLGKEISIKYPFEWVKKSCIVATVRKCGLEKYVWTCEEPENDKPCGKCLPCRNLAVADFAISIGGDFSQLVPINYKDNSEGEVVAKVDISEKDLLPSVS